MKRGYVIVRLHVIFIALLILLPCINAQEKVVYIIGTAHVFDIEEKIEKKVVEVKPDAVAVELDNDRLSALLLGAQNAGEIGEVAVSVGEVVQPEKVELNESELGWLMAMAQIQTQMADSFQAYSGEDMLAGIAAASALGIPVYPIDRHITTTMEGMVGGLNELMQLPTVSAGYRDMISQLARQINDIAKIGRDVLLGIIFSAAKSPVVSSRFVISSFLGSWGALRPNPSITAAAMLPFSLILILTTLATGSNTGIEGMRALYSSFMPAVYETLLAGRERYMAERIAEIAEEHNVIVVITGAAHLTGLAREVESRMPDARVESMTFLDLF